MVNRLLVWLAVVLLGAAPALAQNALTFPPLTGRVVDAAHVLTPDQVGALSSQLQAIEAKTGHQVVVATLADLQGHDISDYGYQLGRAWGIGSKSGNDGIVIIVVPSARKARLEVGYGLEPIVTDAVASVIISQQMAPPFRDRNYAGGLSAAVNTLGDLLQLPPDQAQARAQQLAATQASTANAAKWIHLIPWLIFVLFFILPMFGRRRRGYGYGYGYMPFIPIGGFGGGDSSGGSFGGGGDSFSGGGGSFGGGGASGSW